MHCGAAWDSGAARVTRRYTGETGGIRALNRATGLPILAPALLFGSTRRSGFALVAASA
jgi:hypothetical protein